MPTDRQLEVLDAITRHWMQYGYAPSYRNLCDALGIASPNGLRSHLNALVRDGLLEAGFHREARTLRPTSLRVVSVETLERWAALAPQLDQLGDEITEVIGGQCDG